MNPESITVGVTPRPRKTTNRGGNLGEWSDRIIIPQPRKPYFMDMNIYAVMFIAYIQALRLFGQTLKRIKGLSSYVYRILSFSTSKQTEEVGKRDLSSPMVPLHTTKRHDQC
ncbi:hypothetical protein Hanom_Chr04g00319661 [Helianthus anomalus]